MSYNFQGIASVITATRHAGIHSHEYLNKSISIHLNYNEQSKVARLSHEVPLDWPSNPNFISIKLPDCSSVSGVIADIDRPFDGPGWVTFTVDE